MRKSPPIICLLFLVAYSQLLLAQNTAKERDRLAAAESYFRSGLEQANQKRVAYQPVCDAAKKEFIDAQSKAIKIIRPPVTADGKPVFGFGGSPVNTRTEKGKEFAEFYRRDDRDIWVRNLYDVFRQRAKRYNELPKWQSPILDLRNSIVGDCGHLIRETEIDLIRKYGIGGGGGFGFGGEGSADEMNTPMRRKVKIVVEDTLRPAEYERKKEPIEVKQVIDKSTFMGTVFQTDVFIEGIDTTKLTDDVIFGSNEIFWVSGTKKYTTVLGAERTLLVLKIASDETRKYLEEYVKLKLPSSIEYGFYRDWNDIKGDKIAFGMLQKKDGPSILVSDEGGKEFKIELTQLSLKDRQFIRDVPN